MEKIISAGVFIRESDKTPISKGPITVGAAVVGPTVKGSPLVPTLVSTYPEYTSIFGEKFKSGSQYYEYFTSLTAKEYFSGGGTSLLVTRIISGSSYNTYASADVISQATIGNNFATGSGTFSSNFTVNDEVKINYDNISYRFIAAGPNNIPSDNTSGNLYYFPTSSTISLTIPILQNKINSVLSGSSAINNILVANSSVSTLILSGSSAGTYANGITLSTGSASNFSTLFTLGGGTNTSVQGNSFSLEVLAYGKESNNSGSISSTGALISGSNENIRWEISQSDLTKGTFTLLIRRGDDTNSNKNILETWSNLSLDPLQPNFISRVIGDEKLVYTANVGDTPYVKSIGDYKVSSQYIRVSNINQLHVDSINNDGTFKSEYASTLPLVGSGSYGGSFNGGVSDTNRTANFFENITNSSNISNTQGFISDDYNVALSLLSNKDEYDFNLLFTPGLFLGANSAISDDSPISISEGRADTFAVVDPIGYGGTKSNAILAAAASTSNYGATYWPWQQTFSAALGRPVWVPASVIMAGVYAFNDYVSAEWFAPAGLQRGGLGSVIKAERKLSAADRDDLYSANVNPIASFPGEGVVALGQKTLQKRSTSLDRINVRRLMNNIKRFTNSESRKLLFEQNTAATRNRFLSVMNPYLEQVVSGYGLYAYKIIMDDSNNTADVIDRNQLMGQIIIQPTKTVEYIILDFTLQPTGIEFNS
jgi:hypothetical protein